jgi:hypothetical protein
MMAFIGPLSGSALETTMTAESRSPMNDQLQLFGESQVAPDDEIIKVKRKSKVRDEKSVLIGELNQLCQKVPDWISSAGVMAVREWVAAQKSSAKLAKNERATLLQLRSAVELMRGLQNERKSNNT